MTTTLAELLSPQHLTEVVDIGASPVGRCAWPLRADACRETVSRDRLRSHRKKPCWSCRKKGVVSERYLPHAVGDGDTPMLEHPCVAPGDDQSVGAGSGGIGFVRCLKGSFGEVIRRIPLETRRLVRYCRDSASGFSQRSISRKQSWLCSREAPSNCLGPLWCKQKSRSSHCTKTNQVSAMSIWRCAGKDSIHRLAGIKQWPISPCVIGGDTRRPLHQLLEADIAVCA